MKARESKKQNISVQQQVRNKIKQVKKRKYPYSLLIEKMIWIRRSVGLVDEKLD